MILRNYLSIDESLQYLKKRINNEKNIHRSVETIIVNAIDLLELKPLFKFKGYGTLYRIIKEEGSKNSVELKQVYKLSGYFYDSSTFYPSDFSDFTQFSDLKKPFYYSVMAVVDELVYCHCVVTHYLNNVHSEEGYYAEVGKDKSIESLEFDTNEYLTLSSDFPIFEDFHQKISDSVEIPNQNIFFKISELDNLVGHFSDSTDDTNEALISYLNFEQTIQFINESTNSYFEEGNLIDLIANDYIEPVVYFEGYANSMYNSEKSKYPKDFEEKANCYNGLKWQKNRVTGYFYLMDSMGLIANLYDYGNRFRVNKILNQQAIPDENMPNHGFNDVGGVWGDTPMQEGDIAQLFSYSSGFEDKNPPKFDKKDLRFSVHDIAKCSISLSSLSNKKEGSSNIDDAFLRNENERLKERINILEKQQKSHILISDEPTHHKSVGSMQALLTTLIKMAEYDKADLADPYGELNKIIQAKAEILGLSVKKDFIAKWLKKANDVL